MDIQGISTKSVKNNRRMAGKVNPTKLFQIFDYDQKDNEIGESKINLLSSVNSFLILNEIDQDEIEKEHLRKTGNKLIKSLNQLRLDLVDGKISKNSLNTLKLQLEEHTYSFQAPDIQDLVDDIKLRVAIEQAKIEKNIV